MVAVRECLLESLSILVGKRLIVNGGALQSPKHGIIESEPEELQKPSCRLDLGVWKRLDELVQVFPRSHTLILAVDAGYLQAHRLRSLGWPDLLTPEGGYRRDACAPSASARRR